MSLKLISSHFFCKILLMALSINFPAAGNYQQYQFQLPLETEHLCPAENYKCADNKSHFLCEESVEPCSNYQHVQLTNEWKRIFIAGHNGIRNKVAEDWHIANMNLVHWSRDLETMAMLYLQTCQINKDHCLIVGEQRLRVAQNYCLRRRLAKRWPGRVVRSWYLEIGYNINTIEEYLLENNATTMENFSQMIWPSVEFVGCGAGSIAPALYLIVCYYYPAYNATQLSHEFLAGTPCSRCRQNRNVCSMDFLGLCGIDIDMSGATKIFYFNFLIISNILFYIYYYYLVSLL
ncbi:venom allergen 5-like isoform X2 [Musca domestica]|uniref:Venom allergen 5-like isoform X2 n=1 Tax=Musca domestica TaxID=7370 RepID=A0A9J7HXI8_MUSDO|nr:venom allergen 5-like isoform X2 [Musca domestica]